MSGTGKDIKMTNRKLKNVQRNMLMKNILKTNVDIILSTLVCLNRQGVGRKRIAMMLEEYRTETVPEWEKYAQEDRQDVQIRRALRRINLDFCVINKTFRSNINFYNF